ncbi:SWIM zinc finger family protein [Nocardioides sp. W7]|uniref:SWIM zinc finger family protein n=1 Tax=Nocardioides sp. W7 TaxID=2931390 RepID=UPI001FD0B660|nr:SWIM zinc finger family protein [Nocardioides sp. W7]
MTRHLHPRIAPRRSTARATTWWGKAWVRAVEESAFAHEDLAGARKLARSGRVGQIAVEEGGYYAAVEDEGGMVTVAGVLPVLDADGRATLVEVVAAEAGRIAALMSGELPHLLVEHADEAGVELLPYGGELGSACTCDAWADPCRHALAVLYQLAWLVEVDPFVLLHLRGLAREELLARLHEREQVPPEHADGDLESALDAALRAARLLELLDDPDSRVDHLL